MLKAALSSPRPEVTTSLTRGIYRLLVDLGYAVIPEFTLKTGRRADLMGLSKKGEFVIVEIKSCLADYSVDTKWQDYLDYCDQFYFGVADTFPQDILPPEEGLIIADEFHGDIREEGPRRALSPARRKAMTLRFARQAAFRLSP
ncbi:MAG: MmcB family DNA repair protein [Pseudomonadota bacterium]